MFESLLLDYQKEWLENPQFGSGGRVHNWRRYVPDVLRENWASLQIETRIAIILMAEAQSDGEEWD
jgi:hypothetical protein